MTNLCSFLALFFVAHLLPARAFAEFEWPGALVQNRRTDVFCPAGTWFSPLKPTGKNVCLNNEALAGPLPNAPQGTLLTNLPEVAGGCFAGSHFDVRLGVCVDAHNAYGPFPLRLVQSCKRMGGGPSCESNRWNKSFLEQQERLAQPLTRPDYPVELRGVYISHYVLLSHTNAELTRMAQDLVRRNVNTVYLSVYSLSGPQWPSAAFASAGGEVPQENRATRWAHIFKQEGIRAVAWFEYGLRIGQGNHPIAQAHPEWLQRDANENPISREGGSVFLSPGNPSAVNLVVSMATELAHPAMKFDEIHLDHFHWSYTRDGREFGYEKSTSWLYYVARNRAPSSNVNEPDWVYFRENLLDNAVRKVFEAIKNTNPKITLSACPEAVYALAKHMKQWQRWLAGGYIDMVTPQMYFDNIYDFEDQLGTLSSLARTAVRSANSAAPGAPLSRFGIGLDATAIDDEDLVEQMIEVARKAGVSNIILWSYHDYGNGISVLDNLAEHIRPGHVWDKPALHPLD